MRAANRDTIPYRLPRIHSLTPAHSSAYTHATHTHSSAEIIPIQLAFMLELI